MPKGIKRLLVISGMWEIFEQFICEDTILIFDKNCPFGGYFIPDAGRARKIVVKRHSPHETCGNYLLARIFTCAHLVHELGHCISYFKNGEDASTEKTANRLVLTYFKRLSKVLHNPPFRLVIKDEKKGKWYVDRVQRIKLRFD